MIEQVAVGSLDTPIGVLWIACSERRSLQSHLPG